MPDEASHDESDPLVGETLGGSYRIERVVGEGGMGTVYEARHQRITTRRYAVKTLHPEFLRDAGAVARFTREAEAAAAINSPYVAAVVDVGKIDGGAPYIVGEFLDGEDLGDRLDRVGKLEVPAMVRLVRQVCKGLAAAHEKGVVHRDIKPENIFLTGEPSHPDARVLDFGISRVDSGGTQLTKTGMIMGTPAYMAPEQARGHTVDERADIYATGAMLYRGITGSVPFDRPEPAATIAAVLLEEPPPPSSLDPTIDPALELILQRAMNKDPEQRYQTIAELDEALAPYDTAEAPAVTMVVAKQRLPSRALAASVANMTAQARDVRHARPLLALYTLLATICGLVALWTIAGVIAAAVRGGGPSATLTTTESLLVALTLFLIGLTPGFLLFRHIKEMWTNTMKILQQLGALRAATLSVLFTYGTAWVVVRTVESLLRHEGGAAWVFWDPMLLLLSVAVGMFVARRDGPRPISAGVGVTLLICCTALVGVMRGDVDGAVAEMSEDDADEGRTRGRRPTPAPPTRASPSALASAQTGGVGALAALAKRFPKDPAVLEALALAQGATPATKLEALKTVERLLAVDESAAARVPVQVLVRGAAEGPAAQRDLALSLLSDKMGAYGPDVLYELRTRPALKALVDAKLADAAVAKRATPALRILLELERATGCPAVAALLERATKDADKRALPILQRQVASRTYKCGFLNLKTCRSPPKCAGQALKIQQTMQAIRTRHPG